MRIVMTHCRYFHSRQLLRRPLHVLTRAVGSIVKVKSLRTFVLVATLTLVFFVIFLAFMIEPPLYNWEELSSSSTRNRSRELRESLKI